MTNSIAILHPSQKSNVSFHNVIAYLLRFSQIFGVLPVSNITSRDVYQIRYRWLSIPTFIATIFVLLNGLEFMAVIYMVIKVGFTFHTVGTFTFFTACYLEQLMLWFLATKWPQIVQLWHRTEEVFFSHPYRLYATFNMSLTIKILSGILLVNTFLEHMMYLVNAINTSENQRNKCNLTLGFWENILRNERTQLYSMIPFRMWMLPILEWMNFSMAYMQAFTDIFIMSISIGITTRLKQIHERISDVCEKPMPSIFWKEVRTDFQAVKNLVRVLNSNLSGLILTSCGYSMYFICLQLFNSFQYKKRSVEEKNIFRKSGNLISTIFFWYSLMFVIGRTLFKLFAAAAINDVCQKILRSLRCVPSSSWGNEMTATIVTYELVITDVVQESNKQNTDLCY